MISSIIFSILFFISILLFTYNFRKIIRNIGLGKSKDRSGHIYKRIGILLRAGLGQSKMFDKPIVGILHFLIYLGFIIINIEVIEIIIDGIFNKHRTFAVFGDLYTVLINSFEILAVLVIMSCFIFLIRRNLLQIKRLRHIDLKGWPKNDGNLILIFEILLMSAFLIMNANDLLLQKLENPNYIDTDSFLISSYLVPIFSYFDEATCILIERFCWWFHILGIFAFLNYLVISKHLHIILGFPNIYFSKLDKLGKIDNNHNVTNEVRLMMGDPDVVSESNQANPERFGAKDVADLSWIQLLNAYSCTECGRCTSECPANQTGKLLSPRKIMMQTRKRLVEVGKNIDSHGLEYNDNKSLLRDYIKEEEIWACTTCNACVEACPLNIDPLSIIIDLRRYLVMEESAAPTELNLMFNNIENNGAPWQFSINDRLNWKNE